MIIIGGEREIVVIEMGHTTTWSKGHIGPLIRGHRMIPRGIIVKQMKQGTHQHLRKRMKGGLRKPRKRKLNRGLVVDHHHLVALPVGHHLGLVPVAVAVRQVVQRQGRQVQRVPQNPEDWLRR